MIKKFHKILIAATLCLMASQPLMATGTGGTFNIIPVPESITAGQGTFSVTQSTTIYAPKAANVGTWLAQKLSTATGFNVQVTGKKGKGQIRLELAKKVKGEEAYTLDVTPSGVVAKASTPHGLWNAMQTFLQLLPPEIESPKAVSGISWNAPACAVTDHPRFQYRGVLIDVCRHFFTIDQLKHHIDVLSMYKVNNLHLHLTEDQGWRIEIKKYPRLTEVGAWRQTENGREGGYYTQEQLKDLVKYAEAHYVNIIPEFEMPGHELAAIAAYPWLSCRNVQVEPRRTWGVEPIVMCPGKESTFKFLEDVVDEIVQIFPSAYFHIGGDEAPRQEWKKCPLCQKRADELGLKEEAGRSREAQLQSYVVSRMEKYLNKYGKSIIGWDEILEGGNLNKSAIVMSWRGDKGGITAANAGHHVIMTARDYGYYVDYYQGDPRVEPQGIGGYLPISVTYGSDPVPAAIAGDKAKEDMILGPQVNLWAEYLNNNAIQDYRLYPRALAMSESGWSPKQNKNFQDFCRRLDTDAAVRMRLHNVNFHIPLPEQPEGSCDYEAFTDHTVLTFKTTRPEKMVYTLDGTEPTAKSQVYKYPLNFDHSATLKIRTILPSGDMSRTRTIHIEKQLLSPATLESAVKEQGLNVQLAKGTYYRTEELANVEQWETKPIKNISDVRNQKMDGDYAAIASGYVKVPKDGIYYFLSNNAEVWIDGSKVVDNNRERVKRALHGGRSMALAAGLHKISVIYLDRIEAGVPANWDNAEVQIRYGREGKFEPIKADALYR